MLANKIAKWYKLYSEAFIPFYLLWTLNKMFINRINREDDQTIARAQSKQ